MLLWSINYYIIFFLSHFDSLTRLYNWPEKGVDRYHMQELKCTTLNPPLQYDHNLVFTELESVFQHRQAKRTKHTYTLFILFLLTCRLSHTIACVRCNFCFISRSSYGISNQSVIGFTKPRNISHTSTHIYFGNLRQSIYFLFRKSLFPELRSIRLWTEFPCVNECACAFA